MDKLRVLALFGTRPEAIKMAPLVLELRSRPEIECRVCVTAQHRELLDGVMKQFGLEADYDLDVMSPGQSLCGVASRVIGRLEPVFKDFSPELSLVHGDTATALCSAVAGFYSGSMIGHVEAGLRTWDKHSPYPEEVNRLAVSAIAELHFCPTQKNRENLRMENITKGVYVTGNTALDALRLTVRPEFQFRTPEINRALAENKRVIFLTAHRRENFGEPHEAIFRAVARLVRENPDIGVVYPVHPNPRVRDAARRLLGDAPRVYLIDPIEADEAHNLMAKCCFILTDSGGIQEEGPSLRKPVLVLRTETERPEAVEAGTVVIAGVEEQRVYELSKELLLEGELYRKMSGAVNPFGDGHASRRIADAILHALRGGEAPEEYIR